MMRMIQWKTTSPTTTALLHSALQEGHPTAVRIGKRGPTLQFPEDLPKIHANAATSPASASSSRSSTTPPTPPSPSTPPSPPPAVGSVAPPVRFGSTAPSTASTVRFGSTAPSTSPTASTTSTAATTVPPPRPVSESAYTHDDDAESGSDDQEEFEKVHLENKKRGNKKTADIWHRVKESL